MPEMFQNSKIHKVVNKTTNLFLFHCWLKENIRGLMSLILSVGKKTGNTTVQRLIIKVQQIFGKETSPCTDIYFKAEHIAVFPLAANDFAAFKDFFCFLRISDHYMTRISKWRRSVAQKFNESWNCCNCSMWLRAQPLPVQNKPCADYSPTSSPLWVHSWSHAEVITILQIKWISKPWKLQRVGF